MSRRLGDLLAGAGVAAAAAAGVLLARLAPLAADDPFRGTLAVLPGVVAALAELGRRARRAGGRRGAPWMARAELGALALLVLAVLARPVLALERADGVLFAGLVLLLAGHLARRLTALRPLLGRRLPRRPPALFFALPLLAYLAILPWSTRHRPPDGDEPWYLLITHSLAYDLDADLTNNYAQEDWQGFLDRPLEPQPGDPRGPEGQLYSRHNALLPLFLAPAYRLGGKLGALAAMAALTAALAWTTLRLASRYTPERPGEALAAYALVAFAPPLVLYSYQVWVEVPAALLSMVALDAILDLRARPGDRRAWAITVAVLVLLPLLKIRFMLLSAPLLVLAWWHAGGHRLVRRRGTAPPGERPPRGGGALWIPIAVGLALAAVGAGILLYNQAHYGNPLKIHSWQEMELYRHSPGRYLAGFSGLFFDAGFGLFACAPLWLLLVPAVLLCAARREGLLLDLGVFVLPYLVVVVPRAEWYGGWSPPFRYALVALPLLGLLLVPLLAARHRPGARALVAGLGALTLVLALLWLVVPGWTYNFADGRTYLLDHLAERLGADVARLFPSSTRVRPATWIWPLACLVAVPLLWWGPRRRPRRPALAGVAALLLAAAALPFAARELPTRVVEMEDAQVVRSGGHLHPERWVIERTRYRGGWVLREGEELRAPVVPGGGEVELALDAFFVRHRRRSDQVVEVLAGDLPLASVRLTESQRWQRHALGVFDWPAGAPLVVRLPPPTVPDQPNGVVLDKAVLRWR